MRNKTGHIPVNSFGDDTGTGISIDRITFETLPPLGDWEQPERHDRHSFFLLEKGSVTIEIDFQTYNICSPSVIYMHADQVHRIIGFKDVTVCAWAVAHENINPEYLQLLETISPAAPVPLNAETFGLLSETASLCIKLCERKKDQLYHSLIRDQGNALIALVISQYQETNKPADQLTRAEQLTRAFRQSVSAHYTVLKRPAEYAEKLNISLPYLNECVKATTGQPVSWHIQQRVILEAKRLLYHSRRSLKEIAAMLGYDDYAYFSRLFRKVTNISPVDFGRQNLDSSKSSVD